MRKFQCEICDNKMGILKPYLVVAAAVDVDRGVLVFKNAGGDVIEALAPGFWYTLKEINPTQEK